MAKITEGEFWINLLRKILGIIFKSIAPGRSSNIQHVVPHDEGWAVRAEGSKKVTSTYKYQDDAISRAREIAINYKSSVVIHRKDGTIRDRMNYN